MKKRRLTSFDSGRRSRYVRIDLVQGRCGLSLLGVDGSWHGGTLGCWARAVPCAILAEAPGPWSGWAVCKEGLS